MNIEDDVEARLLDKYFPFFNRSPSVQQGEHYLRIFGITHMIIRILMAIKFRVHNGDWWGRSYCLTGDKVGVTKSKVGQEISRAKRWSDGVAEWKLLLPWLNQLTE